MITYRSLWIITPIILLGSGAAITALNPSILESEPRVAALETVEIHPQYAVDFSDDRTLVGASHNIFVAKILREVGHKENISVPQTQFEAKVLYNIKGDFDGMITINQLGAQEGNRLFIEHDSPLLEIGKTYLLSTRVNESEGWHTLNGHTNAWKMLTNNVNISTEQLTTLVGSDEKISKLEKAYTEEILLEDDIRHNNTLNSFKSLPEAEQQHLQDKAKK